MRTAYRSITILVVLHAIVACGGRKKADSTEPIDCSRFPKANGSSMAAWREFTESAARACPASSMFLWAHAVVLLRDGKKQLAADELRRAYDGDRKWPEQLEREVVKYLEAHGGVGPQGMRMRMTGPMTDVEFQQVLALGDSFFGAAAAAGGHGGYSGGTMWIPGITDNTGSYHQPQSTGGSGNSSWITIVDSSTAYETAVFAGSVENRSKADLYALETDTNEDRENKDPVSHVLRSCRRSPRGMDIDGIRTVNGEGIDGHVAWWHLHSAGVTVKREKGQLTKGWCMRCQRVPIDHWTGVQYPSEPNWGEPIAGCDPSKLDNQPQVITGTSTADEEVKSCNHATCVDCRKDAACGWCGNKCLPTAERASCPGMLDGRSLRNCP